MKTEMPRPGDNVHIPLKTDSAISLLMKVKPTEEMPRPGTHATKTKKGQKKKKRPQ